MPEDIKARIIVTTEASAARQGIDNVKKGLNGITDARERDLKIAQAKSQMELANYQAIMAAQKRYNAELELEAIEKLKLARIKRGADDLEIEERTKRIQLFRGEVLKLQQAEANANLQAHQAKKNYEGLLNPLENVTDATDDAAKKQAELTKLTVLGRLATRLFGVELNATSKKLIKANLIILLVVTAIRTITGLFDRLNRDFERLNERNSERVDRDREGLELLRERISQQNEYLDTLDELHTKERLTNEDALNLQIAIRGLGSSFVEAAGGIDKATGKLNDFRKAQIALRRQQIVDQIEQAKNLQQSQIEQIDDLQERKGNVLVGFWDDAKTGLYTILTLGLVDFQKHESDAQYELTQQIQTSLRDLGKTGRDLAKLQQQLRNFDKFEKDRPEAQRKDAVQAIDSYIDAELARLDDENYIRKLTLFGKEEAAEKVRIEQRLDQERKKFSGAELKEFDRRRSELEREMLAAYRDRKVLEAQEKRLKEIEQTASAKSSAYESISGELMRYVDTVQRAVTASSFEGLRLQSRIFTNIGVGVSDNPAKQSAASLKVIQNKLTTVESRLNEVTTALTAISGNTRSLNGMKFHAY